MENSKHSEHSTIYTSSYLKKRQSISYKLNQLCNKNMNRLLHLKGTKRYLRRSCTNSSLFMKNNNNIVNKKRMPNYIFDKKYYNKKLLNNIINKRKQYHVPSLSIVNTFNCYQKRLFSKATVKQNNSSRASTTIFISSYINNANNTMFEQRRTFAKQKKASKSNPGGGIPGEFVMSVHQLQKIVGTRTLFDNVTLGFLQGAKIGILGLNGCGKSSLMKILAGVEEEFDGDFWKKDDLKVGYLAQEPELNAKLNVRENVMEALRKEQDLLKRFEEISLEMGEPDADFDKLIEEQGVITEEIDKYDAWTIDDKVNQAMQALRVPEDDLSVEHLSGGERRRIALCRLLLEKPDMLLLDEPTNHLDAESVEWLEQFLKRYEGTVIAITHDRYFLDNVAGWILEIERGRALPFEGNYSNWLIAKEKRMSLENKKDASRKKAIQKELEWIRKSAKGQQKKGKARLKSFEKQKDEVAKSDQANLIESGSIVIPNGPRLGNKVVEVSNLTHTFDDGEKQIFDNVSFKVPKGATVGIIGGNGMGKSTLFSMICGDSDGGLKPSDGGIIALGESVQIGYVSQSRDSLNEQNSVYEEISGGNDYININGTEVQIRAYVSAFNLKGPAQEKRVGDLSGGERNRVHLAKTLSQGANLILLDEPTNDLDVETLRSLEEALGNFQGTSMIISHDRYFLDRLCTHILAFEGDGRVDFFEGTWTEYLKEAKTSIHHKDDSDEGKKKRYRPLNYF